MTVLLQIAITTTFLGIFGYLVVRWLQASNRFWKLMRERYPDLVPTNKQWHPPVNSPTLSDWGVTMRALSEEKADAETETAHEDLVRWRNRMIIAITGGTAITLLIVLSIGSTD